MADFIPMSRQEMLEQNIDSFDFIFITGDAYVDHPSFGVAILTRVLESRGFRVGILSQPDWRNPDSFMKLGKPKYAFLISSGNVDSMVAHYTVAKNRRKVDQYSPGGKIDCRPDRAVTVYSKIVRRLFGEQMPIIIGGIEASLRRFAHYDYWDDTVFPSILYSSQADLLVYGMGELQTIEIANRLSHGEKVQNLHDIRGTCYLIEPEKTPIRCKECPSFTLVSSDKKSYAKACKVQYLEQDARIGRTVIQRQNEKMLVQNPPMRPLTQEELDWVFDLPYQRNYHPIYEKDGGVPAIEEVAFSIAHNRGCFGDCNFCAITLHQGREVTTRSKQSIMKEAEKLIQDPRFKGYIHDVGGPTANFRFSSCEKQKSGGHCRGKKCLVPKACPNLYVDHSEYFDILRSLRQLNKIKKIFIRSGIRYDYLLADKNHTFMKELIEHHVSGQLKVAPEHCVDCVLDRMGKPHFDSFLEFSKRFYQITKQIGKKQYLVPYLMSSHPGCTLKDSIELALFLKNSHLRPEQVQDFYPTPGTISTCMYYTGLDPLTMEKVYVPRSKEEKAMQRALLQYFQPANQNLVRKALVVANRRDLIGNGKSCLVPSSNHQEFKKKGNYLCQNKKIASSKATRK